MRRMAAAKMTEAERSEALREANAKMREYHLNRPSLETLSNARSIIQRILELIRIQFEKDTRSVCEDKEKAGTGPIKIPKSLSRSIQIQRMY